MGRSKMDSRFFESTRGKIVMSLRETGCTVNELAEKLGLSDNAVRAHLLTLSRDGLVETGGTVKGFRKPHVVYRLTDEARHIFPKFYDSLFNRLLDSLKTRISPASLVSILKEMGRNISFARVATSSEPLEQRVGRAAAALEELGGAPAVVNENKKFLIKSSSCPFADAVSEHPEVCRIAESLVEEIVGEPVREVCDRSSVPKCRFSIEAAS